MVNAINGISLDLRDGDRLAVVGRNGSGKTTLLKLCAGLLLPDSGRAVIDGSRASVLALGGGLDSDKSGIENVESISRLMSVPRAARKALIDDIVEFTELGDFLNLPVRTYSSGMMTRLVFALATSINRDILVVDEVIGAGDAMFLQKAAVRVRRLFDHAKILMLATHSGEIATQLCNKAIWMESGRPIMSGDPDVVWDCYANQRRPPNGDVNAAA